jgi:hypothetical protein
MFEFLQRFSYVDAEHERRVVGEERPCRIGFFKIGTEELLAAERRLSYSFPAQLRRFYEEIGTGYLSQSPVTGKAADPNHVIRPMFVAALMCLDTPPPLEVPDFGGPRNGFPDGCLPFLDMGDGSFLYLRPQSDNPNAVWGVRGDKLICNDLVEFFSRLYEDPWLPVRIEFPDSFDESGRVRGLTK